MAVLTDQQRDILKSVTTATITTLLVKQGVRKTWMHGPRPLVEGQGRIVGEAFTMRFIAMREDLATPQSWAGPRSTRAVIEDMTPGCVAVVDAMGFTEAGILGDILVERMKQRAIVGLITDGVVRDGAGVTGVGLAVWSRRHRGTAVDRRTDVCRLAGAGLLRRGGSVSGQYYRC